MILETLEPVIRMFMNIRVADNNPINIYIRNLNIGVLPTTPTSKVTNLFCQLIYSFDLRFFISLTTFGIVLVNGLALSVCGYIRVRLITRLLKLFLTILCLIKHLFMSHLTIRSTVTLRCGHRNLIGFLMLILTILVQFFCSKKNITKRGTRFTQCQEFSLLCSEFNFNKVTNLCIQVDAVSKSEFSHIFFFQSEEVLIRQFLITFKESLGKSSILTLHQFFDTNILNDIHILMGNLVLFLPVFIGSKECVSDFVTDEHIIDTIRSTFPHRESQHTGMDVELSSLTVLVLNDKVFCRKEFGKLGFDFVLDCHRSFVLDVLIILNPLPKQRALSDSS